MSPLTVLGVPTSAGAFAPGQEHAPAALREAGLVGALEQRGIDVRDLGDRELWRWRPDPERPRAQNLPQVIEIARDTAARVESALDDGPLLVLGGDCSIELGVLSGHLARDESVGLVYLDLHPDLNTPKSVVEGTFDWMGMAHALGLADAEPELVGVGPRTPLLHDDQVFFLGYGPERAQPFELDQMVRRRLAAIAVDDVAKDPEGSARRALAALDALRSPARALRRRRRRLQRRPAVRGRGPGRRTDARRGDARADRPGRERPAQRRDGHRAQPAARRRGGRDPAHVRGPARAALGGG